MKTSKSKLSVTRLLAGLLNAVCISGTLSASLFTVHWFMLLEAPWAWPALSRWLVVFAFVYNYHYLFVK